MGAAYSIIGELRTSGRLKADAILMVDLAEA